MRRSIEIAKRPQCGVSTKKIKTLLRDSPLIYVIYDLVYLFVLRSV